MKRSQAKTPETKGNYKDSAKMMRVSTELHEYLVKESEKRGHTIYYFTNLILQIGQKTFQTKRTHKND